MKRTCLVIIVSVLLFQGIYGANLQLVGQWSGDIYCSDVFVHLDKPERIEVRLRAPDAPVRTANTANFFSKRVLALGEPAGGT
ncbi:MAG: hypothetical protein GY757_13240, partial [bacterium]|nr:hypothetical protein [bacterium]